MTEDRVKFQTLSDSAIRAQIEIRSTQERVYAAWTQAEVLSQWFSPRPQVGVEVNHLDCVVGGKYDFAMVFEDGDKAQMSREYRELDPPKRLVFTWRWIDEARLSDETLVTVELEPSPQGTLLSLTHERFLTTEARDNHQGGWNLVLGRLGTCLDQ